MEKGRVNRIFKKEETRNAKGLLQVKRKGGMRVGEEMPVVTLKREKKYRRLFLRLHAHERF